MTNGYKLDTPRVARRNEKLERIMADFAFRSGGPKKVYIDHHPDFGEYKVHTGGRASKGSYQYDKEDAEGTARAMYGQDIEIKHRSKRYGPEPD